MKRLLIISILLIFACWLCATCLHAAVPTFESFPTNQYQTNALQVYYRAVHTNDAGIIYPALDNTLNLVTNLNTYGTFSIPTKVTLLTLGTNELDMSVETSWLLNSPTNDAAQVILSLSAGAYQGQFAYINSQNGGNGFTLPDMSEQYDVPGAYVDINGDWIGVTNRGIILRYVAPDWVEQSRFDPSGGGGGSVLGSGANPFLPYWLNATTLTNSPIQRTSATTVSLLGSGAAVTLGNALVLAQKDNLGIGNPIASTGLLVNNTFLASSGVQQNSPGVSWSGQGYGTNTATSQSVTFGSFVIPYAGLDTPTGKLSIYSAVSNTAVPSLVFTLDSSSGYLGGGTLFLSDDGTYKSGGASALWASGSGVLTPSPAVDVVSITSQLASNPTNIALILNTSVPWSGGTLLAGFNQLTNVFNAAYDGTLSIGAGASNFLGFLPTTMGIVSIRDTTYGDATSQNESIFGGSDGVNSTYTDIANSATQGRLTINVDGTPTMNLRPTIASTGSAVAYTFDTSASLATGDLIAAFENHGTNTFTVSGPGGVTVGIAPTWWGPFGPSLLLFANTDHGSSGAWEIFAGGGNDGAGTNYSFDAVGNTTQAGIILGSTTNYVNIYANSSTTANAGIEIQTTGGKKTFITPAIASGSGSSAYYFDTASSLAATESLLKVLNHGTNKFSVSNLGAITLAGTTNQVTFGSTNTAPVSSAAPTKWISVTVAGDAGVYRLPLYE